MIIVCLRRKTFQVRLCVGDLNLLSLHLSGEVSAALLSSVRTSEAMGVFKESDLCTSEYSTPHTKV